MKTDYSDTPMLDIVFEQRNKAYGAYVLRQNHDRAHAQAILVTLSTAIFLCLVYIAGNLLHRPRALAQGPEVVLSTTEVTKPPVATVKPPEQPKPQQESKPKPTIQNTTMQLVSNEAAKDSAPTVDDLRKYTTGLHDDRDADNSSPEGISDGHGSGNGFDPTPPTPVINKPVDYAEIMPQFPGGEEKLVEFMVKHTHFPQRAIDAGIGGKVIAQFVVNEDGNVSDIKIIRSPAPDFDRE
ncbi:MAG TPA: TonB family protein, partial [Chitinophagales bacterium]|nr:TonB family protein [Chitinophagales bacterium]